MRSALSSLFAGARVIEMPAGAAVFRCGQEVEAVYMIMSGRVQLERNTPKGARLILQNAGPGAVLAEASAYSERYHCDATVAEAACLAILRKAVFLATLRDDQDMALIWASALARSVQVARTRAEIRSLPTVAGRLDAWLAEGHVLPGKGSWQDVAAELGVSREALYRELAKRRHTSDDFPD